MDDTSLNLTLRIANGPDAGATFRLGQTTIVGTSSRNEVVLNDAEAARLHVRITRRGDGYHLADLTDANDVKVNGHVVKARRLKEGDTIRIASTELRLLRADQVPAQPERAPAPPPAAVTPAPVFPSATRTSPASVPPPVILAQATTPTPPRPTTDRIVASAPATPEPTRKPAAPNPTTPRPKKALPATPVATPTKPTAPRQTTPHAPKQNRSPRVPLIMAALLVLVLLGAFWMQHQTRAQHAAKQYRAAVAYADANPEQYAAIESRLAAVEQQARGYNRDVLTLIAAKRRDLKEARDTRERKYAALLKRLDHEAERLADAKRYREAIALYESVGHAQQRDRLLAERKPQLEALHTQRKAHESEQAKIQEAELAAARQAADEAWHRTLDEMAEALIAADYSKAVRALHGMERDPGWPLLPDTTRAQSETVSATLQALQEFTKLSTGKTDDAPVVCEAFDALPPAAKAIVLIRRGDLLTARRCIELADQHPMRRALMSHSEASPEILARERTAAKAFAAAWARIDTKQDSRIPTPAKCMDAMVRILSNASPEDVLMRLEPLLACQEAHELASFTERYAPVFEQARVMARHAQAGVVVNDAHIIEVDGRTCYFEAREALTPGGTYHIGLFEEASVYRSLMDNRPLAARVNVTHAQQARVISEHGGMFALPEAGGPRVPEPGTPIVLQRHVRTGIQVVRAETGAWPPISSTQPYRVAGVGEDEQQILVVGDAARMARLRDGQPLYFFERSPSGLVRKRAMGRIEDLAADLASCLLSTGRVDLVSMVSPVPRPGPHILRPTPASIAEAQILVGPAERGTQGEWVTFEPDMPHPVPSLGYLYDITRLITHPHTRDILAAHLGAGVKATCKLEHGRVLARSTDRAFDPSPASQGLLVSSISLGTPHGFTDLPRQFTQYTPDQSAARSFWRPLDAAWDAASSRGSTIQLGMRETERPCVELATPLSTRSQFDVTLNILRTYTSRSPEWARDIMIELYAPQREQGFTFAINGRTDDQDFSILGPSRGILAAPETQRSHDAAPARPSGCTVRMSDIWNDTAISLKPEQAYQFRVRRIGADIALYVNGKRIVIVNWPDAEEHALRVSVMTSATTLQVSSASMRHLSRQAWIPANEPVLGDFGYVLAAEGSGILIDGDVRGLDPNTPLSIVDVENVVRGNMTLTVTARRVAVARLTRIDDLTATAQIIERTAPVTRGMKVFSGRIPAVDYLTRERLQDLARGL